LYSHWTLLRVLWQTDGLTQRQLSEQAGVSEPSTFSALQVMEQRGLITRLKIPGNNKEIRVFVASKGAALRDLIVPAAEEVNQMAIQGISSDDLAITRRTLLAMAENLRHDADSMNAVRKVAAP
jgi:DNA-binding MarR family transcriptional regulator